MYELVLRIWTYFDYAMWHFEEKMCCRLATPCSLT